LSNFNTEGKIISNSEDGGMASQHLKRFISPTRRRWVEPRIAVRDWDAINGGPVEACPVRPFNLKTSKRLRQVREGRKEDGIKALDKRATILITGRGKLTIPRGEERSSEPLFKDPESSGKISHSEKQRCTGYAKRRAAAAESQPFEEKGKLCLSYLESEVLGKKSGGAEIDAISKKKYEQSHLDD